jgi:hypothetical protein
VEQDARVDEGFVLGAVHNATRGPIRVFLEPWAEEHLMPPETSVQVLAASHGRVEVTCLAPGELELTVRDEAGTYFAFTVGGGGAKRGS